MKTDNCNIRKLRICLLLALIAGVMLPEPAGVRAQDRTTKDDGTFTLQQAISEAFIHNHRLRIQKIEEEKAENRVSRGNAGQLPVVNLTGDLTWFYGDMELTPGSFFEQLTMPADPGQQAPGGEGSSAMPTMSFDGMSATTAQTGVVAQYVIFDGFRGRNRYKLLETGSELARLQTTHALEETVLHVTRAYLETAIIQENRTLMELTLAQGQDRYRTVSVRREYGHVSEQQVLQAEADLKSDSVRYRDLLQKHETAWRNLNAAIGWEEKAAMPLEVDGVLDYSLEYDQLLSSLYRNNTGLALLERRLEAAEYEYKLARSASMPVVSASARYGYNYMYATDGQFEKQDQLGFTGGLTVSIPLFTGGRNSTERENARATIRQDELRYEDAERALRTHFDNTWSRYRHLVSELGTERSNLDVYQRNYDRAKDSYVRGLITGIELRSAQLALDAAQKRITELEMNIRLAVTTLFYLTGELI